MAGLNSGAIRDRIAGPWGRGQIYLDCKVSHLSNVSVIGYIVNTISEKRLSVTNPALVYNFRNTQYPSGTRSDRRYLTGPICYRNAINVACRSECATLLSSWQREVREVA